MKSLLKIVFYFWLAVFAMAAWFSDLEFLPGQIALALYCLLGFLGGIAGLVLTMYSLLYHDIDSAR